MFKIKEAFYEVVDVVFVSTLAAAVALNIMALSKNDNHHRYTEAIIQGIQNSETTEKLPDTNVYRYRP